MNLRGSHRLAAITGAAVLVTAISGSATASARTTEPICGPEIEHGAIVYQVCSEVVGTWSTGYGTQPFIYARNRGLVSADLSVTIQRWNYGMSSWETTASGTKTIGAGSDTHYFSTNLNWSCGQDARERGQGTTAGGTGGWSEAVTPAEC